MANNSYARSEDGMFFFHKQGASMRVTYRMAEPLTRDGAVAAFVRPDGVVYVTTPVLDKKTVRDTSTRSKASSKGFTSKDALKDLHSHSLP